MVFNSFDNRCQSSMAVFTASKNGSISFALIRAEVSYHCSYPSIWILYGLSLPNHLYQSEQRLLADVLCFMVRIALRC